MKRITAVLLSTFFCTFTCVADEQPITVGATLALTGKLAFSGLATQRGLELGIQKVNAGGGLKGKKLTLLVEDNAGEPKLGVTGMTKLLNIDKVDVVFSSLTHITQAVKATVLGHGKVMMYAASLADIAEENPLAFRDWGDLGEQVTVLGEAMIADGKKKIALIREQSDACVIGFDIMKKLLVAQGAEVVADETFNPGETDFRGILLRAGSKTPTAFALCAWRDAGMIMKQLSESKQFAIPTYHALAPFLPNNDTADVRALYEQNGATSAWSGFLPDVSTGATVESFTKEYTGRYGEEPRAESAFAYDDMIILGMALGECSGAGDAKCLAKSIQGAKLQGVAGDISFDEKRLATRETFMIKVENGKWRRAK